MSLLVSRRGLFKRMGSVLAVITAPKMLTKVALAAPTGLDAVKLALAGDFAGGGAMAAQSGDTAAVKLVEMLYLRDHPAEAGFGRVIAFLNAAPHWPLRETLQRRAEQALCETNEPAQVILAHFANSPPTTAHGAFALARASFATGDNAGGNKWLKQGWIDASLPVDLEQKARSEFSTKLTTEHHRARLWQLIFAQQAGAAERHASNHLSDDHRNAARAARGLIAYEGGALRKFDELPGSMRSEMAMLYVLARYLRKQANYDKVRSILANVPADPSAQGNAIAWFEERRTIVRRSAGPLQTANHKIAYDIARRHGLSSGDMALEGEFLSGWVALRYLNDAQAALPHFRKVQALAVTGTDHARAQYWLGRALSALGDKPAARVAYAQAAKHTSVYYGQLAREEIGRGSVPEEIVSADSTQAAKSDVEKDELVRAMRLIAQAGNKNQINIFLLPLASRYSDTNHLNAVANVVSQIGGTAWAVRFAKAAGLRGHDLDSWSYPVYGLPNWAHIGKPVEKPLVFALSRQESEFDPDAGSNVGAQGLMQLMPSTAQLVAKQHGIAYVPQRLKDAVYNVRLGAAFLGSLVENFRGSYVLSLVAYNAGPRRAVEWVQAFGDPRGGHVNPVDFVECIPFNETRQYVQKVLQNLHVYRSRLEPASVRPMSADLGRGIADDVAVSSTGVYDPKVN